MTKTCPMCNSPIEDAEEYCPHCGYALKKMATQNMNIDAATHERPIFVARSTQQVTLRAIPAIILGTLFALYLFEALPDVPIYIVTSDLSLNLNLVVAAIVIAITLVRGVLYPLYRYGLGRYDFYQNVVRASHRGHQTEVPYSKVAITGNIRGGSKVVGLRLSVEGESKPWKVPNARSKDWGAELVTWLANRLSPQSVAGSNAGGTSTPTSSTTSANWAPPWLSTQQPAGTKAFKCPNCGAPILPGLGGAVTRCEYCGATLPNPIFESLESTIAQAIARGIGPMMAVPSRLPPDITDSQFRILRLFSQFHGRVMTNPRLVARFLKMDKTEFERDAEALRANGYLSSDSSLTSKGEEILSRS